MWIPTQLSWGCSSIYLTNSIVDGLLDFYFLKNMPATAGDLRDTGSIPGLGRFPGEGNGYPAPVFLSQTWLKPRRHKQHYEEDLCS